MQITAGDFATLNPADFEIISVLKDAAATSTYGSRGANGMNSNEKLDYVLANGNPYGWTATEIDSLRRIDTDWEKVFFKACETKQHILSASGGQISDLNYLTTIGSEIEHLNYQSVTLCFASHFFVNLRLMNYSRFFGANWSNLAR